jgi:hypothetical protein
MEVSCHMNKCEKKYRNIILGHTFLMSISFNFLPSFGRVNAFLNLVHVMSAHFGVTHCLSLKLGLLVCSCQRSTEMR